MALCINTRYLAFLEAFKPLLTTLDMYRTAAAGSIGLRHDVDKRPDMALAMARVEAEHGISSTYFILTTADYWQDPRAAAIVGEISELGHEIGYHNDLLSLFVQGEDDLRDRLERDLEALREAAGQTIIGTASHGSRWAREGMFLNYYVWEEWTTYYPTHPNYEQVFRGETPVSIPKIKMADFFEYEAYALVDRDHTKDYYSDTDRTFNVGDIHTRLVQQPKVQVMVHPNKRDYDGSWLWVSE